MKETLAFFLLDIETLLAPFPISSFLCISGSQRPGRRLHPLLSMLCYVKWSKGIL